MVCSNETLLEKELKHLKHAFHKINECPWWIIDQVSTSIQENINKSKQPVGKMHSLILPYAGPRANPIIKTTKKTISKSLKYIYL